MNIRILLADDHNILREGLRGLLEKQPDVRVVGEANNGMATVQLARELSPDVIIMDITMPGLNGVEATRQIVAANPRVKIVALSVHCEQGYVVAMLKAGAAGYLVKDCAFAELASAVRAVLANHVYLSPSVASVIADSDLQDLPEKELSAFSVLTARECEVLQLLAEGKTIKETASCLRLSEKTIEKHRQRITEKLGIFSIAELTKYAIRHGLTPVRA